MRILFLSFIVLFTCNQKVRFIALKLPSNYSGWVIIIENDKKAPEFKEIYTVNEEGIVYIPKNSSGLPIQFKLYDNDNKDIGNSVKFFAKSIYEEFDVTRKRNVYDFYYPTVEELKLDPSLWDDFNFSNKYNFRLITVKEEMEKKGYFD